MIVTIATSSYSLYFPAFVAGRLSIPCLLEREEEERDRQTERQTDRETKDRERDRKIDKDTYTGTDIQTESWLAIRFQRRVNHIGLPQDEREERETDRQTETDRQAGRLAGRQTDRQ